MQKCSSDPHECYPICDFCSYFRSGWELGKNDIEDGYCKLKKQPTQLTSQCDNYKCFMTDNLLIRIYRKWQRKRSYHKYLKRNKNG